MMRRMLFANFVINPLVDAVLTRATAHSLGRALLGHTKAGIRACIAINKKYDERRAVLKNAQRALSKVMRSNEETAASRKPKQAVTELLLTPGTKKSAKLSLKRTQKSGSKESVAKIAYVYENGIAFNTAASSSFALIIDESVKFARKKPHQSIKEPHRLKFSWKVLDKAYGFSEKLVAPILAVAKQYGVTIASDGWSDPRRRPILNFMASTRGAATLLKSVVHCTDHMAERGKMVYTLYMITWHGLYLLYIIHR